MDQELLSQLKSCERDNQVQKGQSFKRRRY